MKAIHSDFLLLVCVPPAEKYMYLIYYNNILYNVLFIVQCIVDSVHCTVYTV